MGIFDSIFSINYDIVALGAKDLYARKLLEWPIKDPNIYRVCYLKV